MRTWRLKAAVLVLVLLLASASAAADPAAVPQAPSPTHVITELPRLLCIPPAPSSACRDLPPGHFVDQGTWSALDVELRRAQNAETRLKAENASLRSATAGWTPGWRTMLGAVVAGVAGGMYLHSKF